MFAMGEYLKLRYYQLLLRGNPHLTKARSAGTEAHIESAQTLLAGLNPPKDEWLWSPFQELQNWQPVAVHSSEPRYDDLLSPDVDNCFRLEQELEIWKNSSQYQELLNEFLHDLQTVRSNTGLDFEDDLEMLMKIHDSMKTRKSYSPETLPDWFSKTMSDRLAHISDVCADSRYGSAEVQRLYVGRLLRDINDFIGSKIREHRANMATSQAESVPILSNGNEPDRGRKSLKARTVVDISPKRTSEGNIFLYMMDKQRLIALLKSLRVYTTQPQFGSLLIIELHYDPINSNYFIRMFTTNSDDPIMVSEPIRVNPNACGESLECEPQQFEQNLRHLMLDKETWRDACSTLDIAPITSPSTSQTTPVVSTQTATVTSTLDTELTSTKPNRASIDTKEDTNSTTDKSGLESDVTTVTTIKTQDDIGSTTTVLPSVDIESTSLDSVQPSTELAIDSSTIATTITTQ